MANPQIYLSDAFLSLNDFYKNDPSIIKSYAKMEIYDINIEHRTVSFHFYMDQVGGDSEATAEIEQEAYYQNIPFILDYEIQRGYEGEGAAQY